MKKRVGNIIDITNNEKAHASKGYEYWATKHNLKVSTDMVVLIRDKDFNSLTQLDNFIKESTDKRQEKSKWLMENFLPYLPLWNSFILLRSIIKFI